MTRAQALLMIASLVAAATTASGQAGREPVAKDVTVLTYKLHYYEAGSGTPVILLHGLGGEGARWMPNIKALAADFHVFALDQIGFGQSDKPLTNYHNGVFAEFLAGFMKAVGVRKASIVGQSLGGAVAMYFAVHYPEMIDHLVMVDGGGVRSASAPPREGPPDWHARQIANAATREESREYMRLLYYDDSLVTDKLVEDNLVLRLRSAYTINRVQEAGDKGLGGVTEDEARAIKVPTLIVWGKNDELASPAGADRLNAAIPGSRKILIDKAGHYPFIEQAAEFNRIVRDFIKPAI